MVEVHWAWVLIGWFTGFVMGSCVYLYARPDVRPLSPYEEALRLRRLERELNRIEEMDSRN